jgi:hypothetical protein
VAPLGSAFALWALAHSHPPQSAAQRAMRIAVPALLTAVLFVTVTIEDSNTFSLFALPINAFVVLVAAAWTFISRSMTATDALTSQDWFWIATGIMLYAATTTALQPVSWYFQTHDRVDLLRFVYPARAAVDIVGFIAVARGVLCHNPPLSFGGSFSVPSSPLPSSSPPLASRW